jgi:hypothetical protein
MDKIKDSKGNVALGSRYLSLYKFVPAITNKDWDDYKSFLSYRKKEMLKELQKLYYISLIEAPI